MRIGSWRTAAVAFLAGLALGIVPARAADEGGEEPGDEPEGRAPAADAAKAALVRAYAEDFKVVLKSHQRNRPGEEYLREGEDAPQGLPRHLVVDPPYWFVLGDKVEVLRQKGPDRVRARVEDLEAGQTLVVEMGTIERPEEAGPGAVPGDPPRPGRAPILEYPHPGDEKELHTMGVRTDRLLILDDPALAVTKLDRGFWEERVREAGAVFHGTLESLEDGPGDDVFCRISVDRGLKGLAAGTTKVTALRRKEPIIETDWRETPEHLGLGTDLIAKYAERKMRRALQAGRRYLFFTSGDSALRILGATHEVPAAAEIDPEILKILGNPAGGGPAPAALPEAGPLGQRVRIDLREAPISEVLSTLARDAGLRYLADAPALSAARPVTISGEKTLREILATAASQAGLEWEITADGFAAFRAP